MEGDRNQAWTLSDVIDYELQMVLDSGVSKDELARRDKALRLEAGILQAGKKASLKTWLDRVRGTVGQRFIEARQLLGLGAALLGAGLGWATVRGLLTYDGNYPVNVLPFLAIFVGMPGLFLALLLGKGVMARLLGRIPGGWVSSSGSWLLVRTLKKSPTEPSAVEVWHRLKSLHPRLFTWQAWILSQTFGFMYYLMALGTLLFYVSVNDYAFAWQTTLRIGPDALGRVVQYVAWPFAWLGPTFVPGSDVVEATQYDRFTASYVQLQGRSLAAAWWPFLAAIILIYGCLPRLILLVLFQVRLRQHLRSIRFDDLASEEVWLRLQSAGLNWEAQEGTRDRPSAPSSQPLPMPRNRPLLVMRWRQAPFRDHELQTWFTDRGYRVDHIMDAEGRDSEWPLILGRLQEGQALAIVCDAWELPGEAFNRLRLAVREKLPIRTPIFLVPLQEGSAGTAIHSVEEERPLWEASLKVFRDPYVGLFHDGSQLS